MRRETALADPVRRLFWSISSPFVAIHPWSVHRSQKIANKKLKLLILSVQSHSRSSMLIPPISLSPVLVIICSISMLIWNCFHPGRANIGIITF